MQKLTHIEVSEICNQLGRESPINFKQVYGGNIHQTWQLEFKDKKFFLKKNQRKKRFLKFEAQCLRNLQKNANNQFLIIPKVISYLQLQDKELLLLEWINIQNGDQKKLGKGLGEMHIKSAESNPQKFGFPVEGFIGTSKQTKGWENIWIDCFINLRIKPQLSFLNDSFINIETKNRIHKKIRSALIGHIPLNSLVHGDLWSGNTGIDQYGKGVIFDPASWWADSEVDIAMTRLFGGFRKEFYEEYNKVIPLKTGYEKRSIIYNFYHVLNHANMFGGSYFYQVQDYVKRILEM